MSPERLRKILGHLFAFLTVMSPGVSILSAQEEPRKPWSVILVLDRSGSMNRTDRQGLSGMAAQLLADHLGELDQLVLIPFSSEIGQPVELTGWDSPERSRFIKALGALELEGDTDITGALEKAFEKARNGDASRAVIVLLTDGANDPPPSAERYHEPGDEYRRADSRTKQRLRAIAANRRLVGKVLPAPGSPPGPVVFTLGFGQHDRRLMQVVAQRTAGRFFFAGAATDLPGICDDLLRLLKDAYRSRSEPLPKPGVHRITLEIDPFIARASIRLTHPPQDTRSSIKSIRDPDGVVIFEASGITKEGSPAGTRHARGRVYDVVHLTGPRPGRWSVEVQVGDYSLDRVEDRRLELIVERRRLSIESDLDQRGLFWPIWQPLPVEAHLVDRGHPFQPGGEIEGWRVAVSAVELRIAGSGTDVKLPMVGPDASHSFSTGFQAPPREGSLGFQLRASLTATPREGGAPIDFELEKAPRILTFEEYPRGVLQLDPGHVLSGQRCAIRAWLELGGKRVAQGVDDAVEFQSSKSPVLELAEGGPSHSDVTEVPLADDGRGFDEHAGDGILTAVIDRPLSPGPHELRLRAFHRGQAYTAARSLLQVHAPSSLALEMAPSAYHPEPRHYLAGETVHLRARLLQDGKPYGDTAMSMTGTLTPGSGGAAHAPPSPMSPVAGQPGVYELRFELPPVTGPMALEVRVTGSAVEIVPARLEFTLESPGIGLQAASVDGLVGARVDVAATGGPWAGLLLREIEVTRDGQPIDAKLLESGASGHWSLDAPAPGEYRFRARVEGLRGLDVVEAPPLQIHARSGFGLSLTPVDRIPGVTVGEPVRLTLHTTSPEGLPPPGSSEASSETSDVASCLYRGQGGDPPRIEVDGPSGNFHFHVEDFPQNVLEFPGFDTTGAHQIRIRPEDPAGLVRTRDAIVEVRRPRLEIEVPASKNMGPDDYDLGKLSFLGRRLEARIVIRSESFPADQILLDLRSIEGPGGPVPADRVTIEPRSVARSLSVSAEAGLDLPVVITASPLLPWDHYEIRFALRGRDRDYEGLPRGDERLLVLRFEGPYPLWLHILAILTLLAIGHVGRRIYETPYLVKGERYSLFAGFKIGSRPTCSVGYPGLHEEHVIFVLDEKVLGAMTDGVAEASLDDAPLGPHPRPLTDGVELSAGRGRFVVRLEQDPASGEERWILEVTRDFHASIPDKPAALWWIAFVGTALYIVFRSIQYLGA